MASDISARDARYPEHEIHGPVESRFSAVSWGAVLAGSVGAAAMALTLITLGIGLGLMAASPWPQEGASATSIGTGVIIWSIIVHMVSFGLGGYLTGRLRTKWANAHGDEVYFRDSAHGFVTWGVGMLVSFCILTSVAGTLTRGTAEVAAAGAGSAGMAGAVAAAQGAGDAQGGGGNPMDYFADQLFRPAGSGGSTGGTTTGQTATPTTPPPASPSASAETDPARSTDEAGRILMTSLVNGEMTAADRTYLTGMIAQRTGMSQQEAEARVDDVMNQASTAKDTAEQKAKEIADDARQAGIGWALWTFIAMLIGAFSASYAATWGGRARDL